MASTQDDNTGSSSSVMVSLEEGDIEGASLEEPLETKRIPQLRWWLLCHGSDPPASEKKPTLIKRQGSCMYQHTSICVYICIIYRIAGIFRGGKFSRRPLQLYYSNYSRAEFSRNAASSAKN